MNFFRLYGRVLALLGSEGRLAWALALANMALASAQFAEPVLLGRIIDTLTGAQARGEPPSWSELSVLLSAWAGFGLFTIVCGTLIALYADRLAHRRRHVVLTGYFEHVLELPLTYHGNTHSGRLMKVMLQGTDALWGLWVGFFRDHLASFISLLVLLPISLFINWRLASLLIALCVVFAGLTTLIVRKTGTLQSSVEQHYSDLAERASDTLGNIALVQSFSRLEAEVIELRQIVERLLAAQMPVLSWWALAVVLTRTSTTLTVLAIIIVGTLAAHQRPGDHRRDGHLHEFCRPHYQPAGAVRCLYQPGRVGGAAAARILSGVGHGSGHSRPAGCGRSRPPRRAASSSRTCRSPMTASEWRRST